VIADEAASANAPAPSRDQILLRSSAHRIDADIAHHDRADSQNDEAEERFTRRFFERTGRGSSSSIQCEQDRKERISLGPAKISEPRLESNKIFFIEPACRYSLPAEQKRDCPYRKKSVSVTGL
jgi:hypothetical protein